ncbi:peptide chain release factor N(5)-glutamine methyltransferase [Motilimonas pumila]|uniref:Release factor glutamine methyltransferase n=1 Tax=Motilimonas pumila TaxID=2303987 RepID=A0A418YJS0_9GAMM|nr:peptide chain release factor N(5)-glutamine methyltransferase [Motilimonas pumila]RJG51216.1 peptide chain release factor N(5)-glutamine methyltransferase [Motilimonas pumila]
MKPNPALSDALCWGQQALTQSDSAALDCRVLLCYVLQKPDSYLYTWPDKALNEQQWQAFQQLISRRQRGVPVAHLTGEREFWSLPLNVNDSTLIPRPDTEVLVEQALQLAQAESCILDLGTGTGAIALALASELPSACIVGLDKQADAVALAKLNQQKCGFHHVEFLQSDWFSALGERRFDVIVSNPPYIDEQDPHLQQGDVRFEPLSALVAPEQGLADIRHISEQARAFFNGSGYLLFEHGYQQGQAVQDLLVALGYQDCRTVKDYAGNDRVTIAKWI